MNFISKHYQEKNKKCLKNMKLSSIRRVDTKYEIKISTYFNVV